MVKTMMNQLNHEYVHLIPTIPPMLPECTLFKIREDN